MVEPYWWATQGSEDQAQRPVKPTTNLMKQIREALDDLPKTCATFKSSQVIGFGVSDVEYLEAILEYFGSWKIDFGQGKNQYVNPSYIHRHQYSDCFVECECGTKLVHKFGSPQVSHIQSEHNHSESCSYDGALAGGHGEINSRIDKERRQLFIRCGKLTWNGSDVAYRMGMKDGQHSSERMKLGVDWEELKMYGRRKEKATWEMLREEFGLTYEEIGEAFGMALTTVHSRISEYSRFDSDFDPRQAAGFAGGD